MRCCVMKKRNVLLAFSLGMAAGYLTNELLGHTREVSPELALKKAKEAFKQQGPISGSWIYMQPEEVNKNGLTYQAYRGGVTRTIDGDSKQYEFYVDTASGAIISSRETT